MTSSVLRHYDELLGPIYSWTLGDYDARVAASASLFRELLGRAGVHAGRALDLGCGTGVQTLALADLGFEVTGIDFSRRVLVEYRERTRSVGARAIQADLAELDAGANFDVAVCLGDTIAHLQSWDAVRAALRRVHASLRAGGALVLATRDHTRVYEGDARFLLVRADPDMSLTCFLEDAGEHVRVTDIVHRREQSDVRMTASSYLKLRVSPDAVERELVALGLDVAERRETGGVHILLATKRGSSSTESRR